MTRTLDRIPKRVLHILDNWRFWAAVFLVCLSCVTLWLAFVNARTARTVAIQKATARASYNDCIASIPYLRRISRHVSGVNDLASILVTNSRAQIAAAPNNDPLQGVRVANLSRLERAERKVAAVRRLTVPSEQDCRRRIDRFG